MRTVKIEVPDNISLLIGVMATVKIVDTFPFQKECMEQIERILIDMYNSKEVVE